ncbi:MAG: ABC transporter ATP-binding protein [Deltaproteobacteria bacterium]|nr:MAG: ABC transporter ATP-binding protein [Deltaproteobacteria bacterium]
MSRETAVVEVSGLAKTFRIGFFRKRVDAVRGIDFEVRRGEIFGLLGPNGAGKTTTIKMLLQLIFPTKGTIQLFGSSKNHREAMQRVGYMPENPYVYQYLKPHEFLDLCGRLHGFGSAERRKRADGMIERVGLTHAVDRPIGRFSKGMMQRIGLAQALLHDPEFLILDEPLSGLDPIGRKQIRDILIEQRRAGKTLLFTSHILSDVEMLCDRVVILNQGLVTARGSLDELLSSDVRRVTVELTAVNDELRERLEALAQDARMVEGRLSLTIEGDQRVPEILDLARDGGARIEAVIPERETLEGLFVRNAMDGAAP